MYMLLKRLFDFTLAGTTILVLAPILIPVVVGLRLTGEGYVWYKQERVGLKNKPFLIWKFATMLKDSANMTGGIMTTKNDPRITPMGGFLRKSKINEIPQLFNIILGDMSIVGPRPVMRVSFEAYPQAVQKVIYNVKPGLTGIGSIIFRDEEELITQVKNSGGDVWAFYTRKIYPFKGELELWYHENMSFSTDLKLIILTAWAIVFPNTNIYESWFKDLPKRSF